MSASRTCVVEQNGTFIEAWEKETSLWKVDSPGYLKKHERDAARARLMEQFSMTEEEVLKKIKNLRTYFTKELKRTTDAANHGTQDVHVPKWPHFHQMMFMADYITFKKGRPAHVLDDYTDQNMKEEICERNISGASGNMVDMDTNHTSSSEDEWNVDNSSSNQKPRQTKKRQKTTRDENTLESDSSYSNNTNRTDYMFRNSPVTHFPRDDPDDIFGKLVASELKSIQDTNKKRLMKSKILNIIYDTEFLCAVSVAGNPAATPQ